VDRYTVSRFECGDDDLSGAAATVTKQNVNDRMPWTDA
jgi:hypothetical protein